MNKTEKQKQLDKKYDAIRLCRTHGMEASDVAEAFNITPQRVGQIIKQSNKRLTKAEAAKEACTVSAKTSDPKNTSKDEQRAERALQLYKNGFDPVAITKKLYGVIDPGVDHVASIGGQRKVKHLTNPDVDKRKDEQFLGMLDHVVCDFLDLATKMRFDFLDGKTIEEIAAELWGNVSHSDFVARYVYNEHRKDD